jgi:hypothetical protein
MRHLHFMRVDGSVRKLCANKWQHCLGRGYMAWASGWYWIQYLLNALSMAGPCLQNVLEQP